MPATAPANGATGKVSFAWISVPVFPFTFTYRVSVPEFQEGPIEFSGLVRYRKAGPELRAIVTGDAILESRLYHSSDYSPADWTINLSELLRLIQFYNVGEYHSEPGGEDGYAPGDGLQDIGNHAADYNPADWSINLSELLRVIQFYNIGSCHIDPYGEDGYAPGPDSGMTFSKAAHPVLKSLVATMVVEKSLPVVELAREVQGEATYTPGSTIDITITLASEVATEITALGLQETIPAGWTFNSTVSGSVPAVVPTAGDSGTLEFAWVFTPAFPVTFTYRLNVPAAERGDKQIAGQVLYRRMDGEERSTVLTTTIAGPYNAAPQITVLGDNPATVYAGSEYTDAGATAFDTEDGDLTYAIETVNSVDVAVPGTYSVSYSVTDSAGNTANALRTVEVVDGPAPVITVLGENPVTVEAATPYADAGATAQDALGNDLTQYITTESDVDLFAPGTYTIRYNVVDSFGRVAGAVRTVYVVDTTAPQISILGDDPAVTEQAYPYQDAGATAYDTVDEDVSAFITVDTASVDVYAAGNYTVHYSVTDSSGNTAYAGRSVIVRDSLPPTIQLVGSNPVTLEAGSTYVDAGATASDVAAGDLTAQISVNSSVNTAVPGTYSVAYTVADSAGNSASAERTVVVQDTTGPVITLNGANPLTVNRGEPYTEPGATALDVVDGSVPVVVTGTVDTSAAGAYYVTYKATDAAGNTTTATRTVNVVAYSLAATRDFGSSTYKSPGTLDVSVTIANPNAINVANVALHETIPAGWTFQRIVSAPKGISGPRQGATGTLTFAFDKTPKFPYTIKYRLVVPKGQTGTKLFSGITTFTSAGLPFTSDVTGDTSINAKPGKR